MRASLRVGMRALMERQTSMTGTALNCFGLLCLANTLLTSSLFLKTFRTIILGFVIASGYKLHKLVPKLKRKLLKLEITF